MKLFLILLFITPFSGFAIENAVTDIRPEQKTLNSKSCSNTCDTPQEQSKIEQLSNLPDRELLAMGALNRLGDCRVKAGNRMNNYSVLVVNDISIEDEHQPYLTDNIPKTQAADLIRVLLRLCECGPL